LGLSSTPKLHPQEKRTSHGQRFYLQIISELEPPIWLDTKGASWPSLRHAVAGSRASAASSELIQYSNLVMRRTVREVRSCCNILLTTTISLPKFAAQVFGNIF
jgi:hypothetical protein